VVYWVLLAAYVMAAVTAFMIQDTQQQHSRSDSLAFALFYGVIGLVFVGLALLGSGMFGWRGQEVLIVAIGLPWLVLQRRL
jgi:hypothetical protein